MNEERKKLIVLIEDEEIILGLLVKKLEAVGYVVKTATDGEAGLLLIRSLEPDLILLDMMLPKLDGFGVLERLASEHLIPKTPLIIISNSGQPIEIQRALNFGVRDYLIKVNFDPNDVVTKVQQVIATENANRPVPVFTGTARNATNVQALRVLMIEDDMLLVQLLERKLLQQHYDLHKGFDADQARKVLNKYTIDIILLDIILPGMDGFTFLKEVKASPQWKDIPVIIMSNLGQQEEIDRGLREGAADYIIKAHSTPQEIITKVEALMSSRRKAVA